MMKTKRIISLLLAVLLVVTMLPMDTITVLAADEQGTLSDTVSYTIEEATGTLTLTGTGETPEYDLADRAPFGGSSTIRHIVIGEGVTALSSCLFYSMRGVESVTLPSTLETIADDAFRRTAVTGSGYTVAEGNPYFSTENGSLFNKDKTELKKYVDQDTAVYEEYQIPSTVNTISPSAFTSETTLGTLTLAGSNLVLKSGALDEVKVKHLVIAEGVVSLGSGCTVSGDVLEDTQITLPSTLQTIGTIGLLNNVKYENIYVSEANEKYYDVDGVVVQKDDHALVLYPAGRQDTSYVTPDEIKRADQPNGIYNNYLEEVTFSKNVEAFGSRAVTGKKLKSITVLNPFAKFPDAALDVFGSTSSVPLLAQLNVYQNSTARQYVENKVSRLADKLVYLPDCTEHTPDLSRRVEPTCTDDG